MRRALSAKLAAALATILLVSGVAAVAALRRTSTSFDEIVLVAAGAHAAETGDRSLLVDQPPLMGLLYGTAVRTLHPTFPRLGGAITYDDRWNYARAFYFDAGNDPERIAFRARLVGVACMLGLIVAVFLFALHAAGAEAAVVSALLVAFLPDVLAHAGVAYNDLPMALGFFLGLWALDAFVRAPGVARGALAGAAVALALGIKFSALALGPVGIALLAAEAVSRRRERSWWRALAAGTVTGALAWWLVSTLIYAGDPTLRGLRLGYYITVLHASEGHTAPAYLLGATSATGWWWYFPVSFFLKTPIALHSLLVGALVVGVGAVRRGGARALLACGLRAPLIGFLVFGGFLLASSLNAGFRYALPALPALLVLVGGAVARVWRASGRRVRIALALVLALDVGSALSAYPWYLSYVSAWGGSELHAHDRVLDSSLDWGQGLLALRDWMTLAKVERVRLSYFGSALPAGYGIRYEALPSFLNMPADPVPSDVQPIWTAISATNLRGLYFGGKDLFAAYREREPDAVVGGSILLFHEPQGATP